MDTLKFIVKNAPRAPGVYLMKDRAGKVIYVGKANDLRARVGAYLSHTDSRFMIPFLVSQVMDVEFIVTETEKEALILENNLIKAHRPRYNVDFRDDKAYYHIRLAVDSPFPRLELIRRPREDGARYFGPYPSSASARETLRFIQQIFPLRTCRDRDLKSRRRACLEFGIRRCLAPCVGLIDRDSYRKLVQDTVAFLEGRVKGLLHDLHGRMLVQAEGLNYEAAARLRDRIEAVRKTLERQNVHSPFPLDQDIFGIYQEGNMSQICALFIRRGDLMEKRAFPLLSAPGDEKAILSSLIKQYYLGGAYIPDEIVLPVVPEDREMLAELLRERRDRRVTIRMPRRGRLRELIRLARVNAGNIYKMERHGGDPHAIPGRLAEKLGLAKEPRIIECYDISNLGGSYAVGSRVTFRDGLPWKAGYRRFRIRTLTGADDYGMMYEVLHRRFSGEKKDAERPDLIIVDGGKGHLAVALAVLKDLGVTGIEAISLAKESRREPRPGGLCKDEERIYLPGRKDPLYPSRWPPLLMFLQRIRDEAHRFARGYHRKLKEKGDLASRLDLIPGIGQTRRKALLSHFDQVGMIAEASLEELSKVPGLGRKTAERIREYFDLKDQPPR
ncbi:MAG: excinuclease ABC subunit UvrC [Smithellaceae bacterium]|nr:excinuclease ABC subunit UvrC [Smithellaceae bacterium]